jgi:PAS domain S-box-containing protein
MGAVVLCLLFLLLKKNSNTKSKDSVLEDIVSSLEDGIIATDEEGVVVFMNGEAERLTGWTSLEASGHSLSKIMLVSEMEQEGGDSHPVARTIGISENFLFLHHKNGSKELISKKTFWNRSASGEIQGIIVCFNSAHEIHKRNCRTVQNQKMNAIGVLASGLAHDMNNVLAGIMGASSLMEFRLKSLDEENQKHFTRFLQTIEKSTDRAAAIVDRLGSLARRPIKSNTRIDLRMLLQNVVSTLEKFDVREVKVETSFPKESAWTTADFNQMEQAVLHIAQNAVHAMTLMKERDAGGRLRIKLNSFESDERFTKENPEARVGSYWILSVEDEGVGIKENNLEHIFTPFFSTKEHGKGIGLGLSMAFNVVSQSNGFILVNSQEGKGSCFEVYLPAVSAPVKKSDISEDSQNQDDALVLPDEKLLRQTVLVVDDDATLRSLATAMLSRLGYQCMVAEDGKQALDIYRSHAQEIDLILLDMIMPGLTGKEVFNHLKNVEPNVRVVISSGDTTDKRVLETLDNGALGTLQKPYRMEALSDVVKRHLQPVTQGI